MQQNIIFAGPDKCGKTNIAKCLSEALQIPYFKASDEADTFTKNPEKFALDIRYADPRLADFLKQTGHSAIFDRGYPCEWVYSKYYNRATDDAALDHVDSTYASMGTLVVIPYRTSYNKFVDDLDKNLKGDELKKIEGIYRDFSKWTKCRTLLLNVDSHDLQIQVKQIIDFLAEGII